MTAPLNPSSVQVSNRTQSKEVIPHSNLGRQETPCKLGRSTPLYFKLWRMSCCRSSSMSNSSGNRWKLVEQTVIRVRIYLVHHTKLSHAKAMTQQETLIGTKPGHLIHLSPEKLNVTFSSWPPHRRTILKDWGNKCKIATK